jgi:hypothetical protein
MWGVSPCVVFAQPPKIDKEGAEATLEDIYLLSRKMKSGSNKSRTLGYLCKIYAKMGNYEKALQLAAEDPYARERYQSLLIVAKYQALAGKPEAKNTYQLALQNMPNPSEHPRDEAMKDLALSLAFGNNFEDANKALGEISDPTSLAMALNSFADIQRVRLGGNAVRTTLEYIMSLLPKIPAGSRAAIGSQIVTQYAKLKQYTQAWTIANQLSSSFRTQAKTALFHESIPEGKYVEEALEAFANYDKFERQQPAIDLAIHFYNKKNMKQATQVIQAVSDPDYQTIVWCGLAYHQNKKSDKDGAKESLANATSLMQKARGDTINMVGGWKSIGAMYLWLADKESAGKALQAGLRWHQRGQNYQFQNILVPLIYALDGADSAKKFSESLSDEMERANSLLDLARKQLGMRVGLYDETPQSPEDLLL